jgi:phytol kinase
MTWLERKFFKFSLKNLGLFAFLWLMVGFTIGTETLLGPVRWIAKLSVEMKWHTGTEDIVVKLIIVVFVACSCLISIRLTQTVIHSKLKHVIFGIPLIVLLATVGAFYFWLNPQVFGTSTSIKEETIGNAQFAFGPFPTQERLYSLREEGYTAVISLLHPAVIPFEPKLLADEKKASNKVGIELIHIPMLPWISENEEGRNQIRALAESGQGRYYVHCYLGKDRVNVVKRIIESTKTSAQTEYVDMIPSSRRFQDISSFERGEIIYLEDDVYLTPYPTDEEYFGYVLAGSIKQVVSLLNPDNPDDKAFISKEKELLSEHEILFRLFPISLTQYNPREILEFTAKLKQMPRPLLIHGFLNPSFRTEAILQAYRSHLPPLPPLLFRENLAKGRAEVIAPNIAVGPRPNGPEFGAVLYARGVRKFGYLGDPNSQEAREDARITKTASLFWEHLNPDSPEFYNKLSEGGPWYLYGPSLSELSEEIQNRLGPAIPDKMKIVEKEPAKAEGQHPLEPTPIKAAQKRPEKIESESEGFFQKIIRMALDFLERSLPDLKSIILLGPIYLLYGGMGGAFVGWLRMKKNVRTSYTRKIFHFFIFTMAGTLHLSFGLPAVVLFGVMISLCVLYATFRGNNFPFYEAMARPTDAPHRTFYIIVPLITTALGGGISNLFLSEFAFIGYFVGGWGDAVGEPIGTKWGKHKYKVPSLLGVPATRSLEGSLAVFLFGSAVAFLGLFSLEIPFPKALLVALACGGTGAAVEAISTHGLDNLTIQVAATAVAYLLLT